jgi:hypothetical protein
VAGNSWANAAARVQAGDFSDLIDPLDYMILAELPDFDTNMGGLYQIGTTVKKVMEKLNERAGGEALTSGSCSARLKLLTMGGLVRQVRMVGRRSDLAYQKTTRGEEVLKAWLEQRNS